MQPTACVKITAPGAGHCRREYSVGKRSENGRHRSEQKRGQNPRANARDVSLNHDRNDVHRRTQHGADAGRREPRQAELTLKAGTGRLRVVLVVCHRIPYGGADMCRCGRYYRLQRHTCEQFEGNGHWRADLIG